MRELDYASQQQVQLKDFYHLEIDAETGRRGQSDENIKIYQVDAPDRYRKRPQAPAHRDVPPPSHVPPHPRQPPPSHMAPFYDERHHVGHGYGPDPRHGPPSVRPGGYGGHSHYGEHHMGHAGVEGRSGLQSQSFLDEFGHGNSILLN